MAAVSESGIAPPWSLDHAFPIDRRMQASRSPPPTGAARPSIRLAPAPAMRERRLLICDDEPAFGRFVRTVAEGMGYRVQVTANGRAFIAAYAPFQPTTVVLDMIMPEMDGHQIVDWLARRRSRARIIIITGFTPDFANPTKMLADHKGLRPVITLKKPLQLADLRAVLADEDGFAGTGDAVEADRDG